MLVSFENPELEALAPLSGLVAPWLADASEHLRTIGDMLAGHCGGVEHLQKEFLRDLRGRLMSVVTNVLVLELNIARVTNTLAGVTPESRFRDFAARLCDAEFRGAIFQEYPVTVYSLDTVLNHWRDAGVSLVRDIIDDYKAIVTELAGDRIPGAITSVHLGAGDLHMRGRSTSLLRFDADLRIVYKSHSLASSGHFQNALEWLNRKGFSSSFQTVSHLDRGGHGWAEFVPAKQCDQPPDVQLFYRRVGGLLALLYALCATDMHSENIIASGAQPLVIDHETLFQPLQQQPARGRDSGSFARDLVYNSVAGIGLLPHTQSVGGARVDRSGVGRAIGQLVSVPSWANIGTDEMCIVEREIEMSPARNRPSLNKQAIIAQRHVSDIVAGFCEVYELFREHKEHLLKASGPVAAFADAEVRVLLRPTRQYADLLRAAIHPDTQRSWRERSKLFEKLHTGALCWQHISRAVPFERLDLEQGDIPYFTTRPSSRDLWSSTGERIRNFLPQSGQSRVVERIRNMGQSDLHFQIGIIETLMASRAA